MKQPYGSRWSVLHAEAYRIWLSSADEPKDSPRFGMRSLLVLEDEVDKAPAMAAEVWAVADKVLTNQQVSVLRFRFERGLTLDEIAQRMFVTRERIRQIEWTSLEELRRRLVLCSKRLKAPRKREVTRAAWDIQRPSRQEIQEAATVSAWREMSDAAVWLRYSNRGIGQEQARSDSWQSFWMAPKKRAKGTSTH